MNKIVYSIHVQHFSLYFVIFMANYLFEKMLICTFFRGVCEKVCFVHSFKCCQLWTVT